MRKKFITMIAAIVIANLFVVPVMADTGGLKGDEIIISPMYTYISKAEALISINSCGKATIETYVTGNSEVASIKATINLQQYNDGSWTTIKTWDEIHSSGAVIVHEDPDQIQSIEITNYELQSFINGIEDEEKRALLYEISITPVKEEAREYSGDDISLNSDSYTSADSIKVYKELAQMTNDELRKKLDEVKAMNAALVKNEKMLNYNFFHKADNIKSKADDVSSNAVKSYTHTMEKTQKDLIGNMLFGLRCKVEWNVSNGKITYLAPSTTRLYNQNYTYYGALKGSENLTNNDTRGVVFKYQSFGLKKDGYASATVNLAGNYYTDGTCAWNGEIN